MQSNVIGSAKIPAMIKEYVPKTGRKKKMKNKEIWTVLNFKTSVKSTSPGFNTS